MVGLCNVWLCSELCGRAVYYVLRWWTVVQGGVLCGMVVYCAMEWCNVWYGGVLCGRVVYCVLG